MVNDGVYIYIYRILSPVKPELGVIPSGQENIREYLDLPGKELNVSIIQSNNFWWSPVNFFSCFWKFQKCVTGLK